MLPASSLDAEFLRIHTTGFHCNCCIIPQAVTQPSAPEDGRNHRPKHVELIGINNKPLWLRLVGCLHYMPVLFQYLMGNAEIRVIMKLLITFPLNDSYIHAII